MRQVHRLIGLLGGPLAQFVVAPGAFDGADVQGLPGRQGGGACQRGGQRAPGAGQDGERQRLFQRRQVSGHLVDEGGRAHLPVDAAQQLGLVHERLDHAQADAARGVDAADQVVVAVGRGHPLALLGSGLAQQFVVGQA